MIEEQNYISDIAAPVNAVESAAARNRSGNKILIIALIACAMLAVIFAVLFFNARANNDSAGMMKNQSAAEENQSAHSAKKTEDSAQAQAEPDSSAPTAPDLSPELKALVESQHRLEAGDPMAKGNVDAPVVIEVYADFRCGHCINYTLTTEPQLEQRIAAGEVRYEFNFLPVLGEESVLAAQAAKAAANQNKFWEYHDLLFAKAGSGNLLYTDTALIDLAKQAGVPDLAKFSADFSAPETVSTVQSAVANAQQLGINGVPAFLVGYSYVPGEIGIDQLNSLIDQELQRAK